MAVASWNEWQNNLSWNGNTGARNDKNAYANYVNEYQKFDQAGDVTNMRVLNNAHGFTPGVASDNAPVAMHAPSGLHKGGGGGGGGGGATSELDMLLAAILADLLAEPEAAEPEAAPEGDGLAATLLSSSGRPRTRRTYLTPAEA